MFDINVVFGDVDGDVVVNKDFLKKELELFDMAISKLDHQEDDADVQELFYYEDLRKLYVRDMIHKSICQYWAQVKDSSHWLEIAQIFGSGLCYDRIKFEKDYGITYKGALRDMGINR